MKHFLNLHKSLFLFLIGSICLLSLCVLTFTCSAIISNLIPIQYVVLLDSICVFVTVFSIYACIKLGNISRIVSSSICLLLSIALCFGSYLLSEANNTLKNITSSDDYYDQVSIVVLSDSKIVDISELDNKKIGVQYQIQSDVMSAGINKIQNSQNIRFEIVEYDDISSLTSALLNQEIDAALYNSSYISLISEEIEGFDLNTKVLYECNLTLGEVDMIHKLVDDEETLPSVGQVESTSPTVNDETISENTDNDDVFAVYLSGIDVYGSISLKSRSDVNIIAIVNPNERKVLLVTTPRDYFVPIPGVSGDKNDKLTHAGIYGIQASMDTLSQLYDVDIDYYFRVNFTSFEKIIDSLGGVDVYSQYNFSASGYSFQKGYNHVNGKQALVFARERYSFAAGDNQRGKNQQELIKAIIKKACSPAILTAAGEILDSVRDNIDTNIPEGMIQDIIRKQLEDNREWQIETLAATGTGSYDEPYSMPGFKAYVMIPNEDSVNLITESIKQMYN